MATFILLSAIPGSGKSTWAKAYQLAHPNVCIVASDEIRRRLFGAVNDFSNEALVWETFLDDINAHAEEDCTVIADATNLQNRFRVYYRETTPKFDRHILVLFDIPFDVCAKQNKMRHSDSIVSDEGMKSLYEEFEPVSDEVITMYDEYYVIGPNYVQKRIK